MNNLITFLKSKKKLICLQLIERISFIAFFYSVYKQSKMLLISSLVVYIISQILITFEIKKENAFNKILK